MSFLGDLVRRARRIARRPARKAGVDIHGLALPAGFGAAAGCVLALPAAQGFAGGLARAVQLNRASTAHKPDDGAALGQAIEAAGKGNEAALRGLADFVGQRGSLRAGLRYTARKCGSGSALALAVLLRGVDLAPHMAEAEDFRRFLRWVKGRQARLARKHRPVKAEEMEPEAEAPVPVTASPTVPPNVRIFPAGGRRFE